MRWVFGIAGLVGGGVLVLLLFRLGAIDFADSTPGIQTEPGFTLPTYLTFVGVMLTAVTVVLAAVAIGIGVIAAYTIQELRQRADKRVEEAVDKALSDTALNNRVAQFVRVKQSPTVAELEEGFDPDDTGNR